jgi:hypothetical protein
LVRRDHFAPYRVPARGVDAPVLPRYG